jgi:hypothetical protein
VPGSTQRRRRPPLWGPCAPAARLRSPVLPAVPRPAHCPHRVPVHVNGTFRRVSPTDCCVRATLQRFEPPPRIGRGRPVRGGVARLSAFPPACRSRSRLRCRLRPVDAGRWTLHSGRDSRAACCAEAVGAERSLAPRCSAARVFTAPCPAAVARDLAVVGRYSVQWQSVRQARLPQGGAGATCLVDRGRFHGPALAGPRGASRGASVRVLWVPGILAPEFRKFWHPGMRTSSLGFSPFG